MAKISFDTFVQATTLLDNFDYDKFEDIKKYMKFTEDIEWQE